MRQNFTKQKKTTREWKEVNKKGKQETFENNLFQRVKEKLNATMTSTKIN